MSLTDRPAPEGIFDSEQINKEEVEKLGWILEEFDNAFLFYYPLYHKNETGYGFEFAFLGTDHDQLGEEFFTNIVHGRAYFDGLRHIYFGEDGYIYCPGNLVKALKRIDELQTLYCSKDFIDRNYW